MRALGVEFAPLNIPLRRRMQTLAALFCAFLFFLNVVWGAALFAYLLFFTPFYYVPLLYTIWLVYDFKRPKRGGRPNGWVRRWLVWKYAGEYYPVSLVKTGELDPNRNYIFGYHPHGISCVGAFLNFGTDATGFSELYPGITTVLLTLNVNVHCPFSRELCLLCGLISADRDSLQWTLTKQGVGNAAIIAVGGAQEALDAHKGMSVLTLRNRKGFVRCALQCGADLVPVFSFGENDIYYQAKNPPGSRLRRFQEKMKALTGFSPVIFHGRGIFQYNFGYVPFRERIVTVASFAFHGGLLHHFEAKHGFVARHEKLEFNSLKEFSDWREAEEGREHAHFVLRNGPKKQPGNVLKRYYYCHRSGSFQSTSQGKRQLKTQGSCKTNVECLATIRVTEKDGKVTVEYQAEHYGHPKELKHQRLSMTEKEALADKLKQGIPARKVLVDARSSAGSEMGRLHLLSMKDIGNISVKHEILTKERRHKNQFKSVSMWVEELNKQSDSPVLYFDMEEGKEKETFELALMTVPQKELLTKLGPKFLCIDSTHNTNGHNLQLTTLMTVAEDQSGMPCAYLISKKLDTETMKRFFKAIKEKIGNLECEAFMSDDAAAYGNAWEEVMGPAQHRMLCSWHVNRNWTQKLQLVQDKQTRDRLRDELWALRNCKDEAKFQEGLTGFLCQKLSEEADPKLIQQVQEFLQYFERYYGGRAQQWALCFRKGIPFNTNNHLEAMHKDLKSHYMHGTHNQRLDKLLMILFELTRDRLYKRLKSLVKGKTNRHDAALFRRHQEGIKIPASDVEQLQNGNGWLVKSQSQAERSYHVEKGDPCQSCVLRCKDCDICIDSYKCTCNDSLISASMCKHIHAVAYLGLHATTVEEVDTVPDVEMPSTTREATGFTLDDEPQTLLDDIRQSIEVGMQKTQPNSGHEIRLALSGLNESFSRKELPSSSSSLVLKYFTKAQKLLDSAPDKTSPPDETSLKPRVIPHNKKMEKQARYFPTKKKRPGSGPMHGKPPTRLEQQHIMEGLVARQVPTGRAASAQLPVDVPSMSVLALKDHDYFAYQ